MRKLCPMLVAGLLLVLAAGARADEEAPPHQQREQQQKKKRKGEDSEEVVKQGQVQVVRSLQGGEPRLTDQEGKRWLLDGELREELLRLSGHAVRVWAAMGPKKLMTPTLAVRRYELVADGARRPHLGILRRSAPLSFTLENKAGVLRIEGRPALLKQLDQWDSCKVWIAGELEGKVLKAYKFGWISCKKTKAIKPQKESRQ